MCQKSGKRVRKVKSGSGKWKVVQRSRKRVQKVERRSKSGNRVRKIDKQQSRESKGG